MSENSKPVSSPEEEVREIAAEMWDYMDGHPVGPPPRWYEDHLREAQRLATERAERECAELIREGLHRYHTRDEQAYLESLAAEIEGLAEGRSKGK